MLTLEETIIHIDNKQLGYSNFGYCNEADKAEELQLRNWLQELRSLRKVRKVLLSAMKRINPRTESEIMTELISENEELKAKIAVLEANNHE